SLEAMLVSVKVEHGAFFAGLRAVVVDEVHAFAGDDRGWHLLAVLERLTRVTGRQVQRVGLSATVGNPHDLLTWLQGSGRGTRPARVIAPGVDGTPVAPASVGEIELDYVGSVSNAATVISPLHRGEKRLVFCDSRQLVEAGRGCAAAGSPRSCRTRPVGGRRRRAELAFAEAATAVIVSTSTLELGIDVRRPGPGHPDQRARFSGVVPAAPQAHRPPGRDGAQLPVPGDPTRPGGLDGGAAPAVEQGSSNRSPRHRSRARIVAQRCWRWRCRRTASATGCGWRLERPRAVRPRAEPILQHLVDNGFLDRDGDMLFIGPAAEQRFGRRHFMDMAVFTAPPQFTVLHGRRGSGAPTPPC
ncbi:ATP-dependent helicase, partial [Saccharothrix sp. MB29]|nr:ATP-dependent helicase [Saccharothrix sp. MB29]